MGVISISERKKRMRELLAGEATNAPEVRRAIRALDARRFPFEAEDYGAKVAVVENLGEGYVRFDVGAHAGDQRYIEDFASRLTVRGKPLVPKVLLRDVPEQDFPGKLPAIVVYAWERSDRTTPTKLWVPDEVHRENPERAMQALFMGIGGFGFGPLTHQRKQNLYRLLPKLSALYGGRAVCLVFEEPPPGARR